MFNFLVLVRYCVPLIYMTTVYGTLKHSDKHDIIIFQCYMSLKDLFQIGCTSIRAMFNFLVLVRYCVALIYMSTVYETLKDSDKHDIIGFHCYISLKDLLQIGCTSIRAMFNFLVLVRYCVTLIYMTTVYGTLKDSDKHDIIIFQCYMSLKDLFQIGCTSIRAMFNFLVLVRYCVAYIYMSTVYGTLKDTGKHDIIVFQCNKVYIFKHEIVYELFICH